MAQAVLDIGDCLPPAQKVHCPAVPEGVDRIDVLKTLRRQRPGEMLLTEPIDSVAGELLAPLADKEPVLIKGLGGAAIFLDVETEELRGPLFQVYEPEAVPFAEDRQGVMLGVEVVEIEGGDLGGPGAGVEEEMKKDIVPEALFSPEVDRFEDLQNLVMVKEPDQGLPKALLGDVQDGIG